MIRHLIRVTAFCAALSPAFAENGVPQLGIATGLDTLRAMGRDRIDADFAAYSQLGATWVRTDLNWSLVQPDGPDRYDWSSMDGIVMAAKAKGLQVLPVVSFAPSWAWPDPERYAAPADPETYATFLRAAVARYAPMGIHAWEIWNEPNLSGPWPNPSPADYTKLLRSAYTAIKAADKDATVIAGGLASVPNTDFLWPKRHYSAVKFLEVMYEEGAAGYFDALAFHPYSYPHQPSEEVGWSGWTMMQGPVRDLMVANGDGDKKIWITEYGAPTNGSDTAVSEQEQAQMLLDSISLVKSYSWAGPVFWYDYRDRGSDPDNVEDWFGMITEDGRHKPVYDAFRMLTGAD